LLDRQDGQVNVRVSAVGPHADVRPDDLLLLQPRLTHAGRQGRSQPFPRHFQNVVSWRAFPGLHRHSPPPPHPPPPPPPAPPRAPGLPPGCATGRPGPAVPPPPAG